MKERQGNSGMFVQQESIGQLIQNILRPAELDKVKGVITRLDQYSGLTLEQKRALLDLSVWQDDPDLKGRVAQQLGIDLNKIRSHIDTVECDPYLTGVYIRIIEDPEEPIIDRVKRAPGRMPPAQMARNLGISPGTAASYRSLLIQAGKAQKLAPTNQPSPQTAKLDNFVAETLKANPNFSNRDLSEKASETLNRPISRHMIENSVFRVTHIRDDVPKRKERKAKQTWSTAKGRMQETKARLERMLHAYARLNPGKPVDLKKIASEMGLSLNYTRILFKQLSTHSI